MAITPSRQTIEQLLNIGNARFMVPSYQRGFDWGKDEADDLWNDVISSDQGIYLGNIVLDVKNMGRGEISIVDGQQRITTICLLLIACRARAIAIKENKLASKITEKLTFSDSTTGEMTGARLGASIAVRDIFEYIVRDDWKGDFPAKLGKRSVKRQVNKIKPVYELFRERISSLKKLEDISTLLRKLYSSFVIKIEVDGELDVFDLFERANARGLELNAADLLKADLFSAEIEGMEETWDEIVENADTTMMRMLKYYLVARKGAVQKRDIFKNLQKQSSELKPEIFVKDLSDFSTFYAILRQGREEDLRSYFEANGCLAISRNQHYCHDIYLSIEALRLFRVTQPYPIIYSAVKAYQEKYGDNAEMAKLLRSLIETFEKYHFVNNVICERVGNEIEKTYMDFAPRFNKVKDFKKNCSELIKTLEDKKASYEEFESKFKDLSYATSADLPLISYVIDRINNFDRVGGQKTQLFFLDRKGFRRSFNVEHFYPNSKRAELSDPDIADNIGNLLIISLHTNSKLQDKMPLEKIEILKNKESFANLPHVKTFIEEFESHIKTKGWGADEIAMRAGKLAHNAYYKVWHF